MELLDAIINSEPDNHSYPVESSVAKYVKGEISVALAGRAPESNVSCSPHFEKVSTALAKAQGEIRNPTKDANNPHFDKNYADLAGGIDAIREAFSKNEIAYIQTPRIRGNLIVLYTRLIHSSGQWLETEWPAGQVNAPPQQQGSALTYARRYSLFSIAGIAGRDDDDDGNAASDRPAPQQQPARGKTTITSGRQKLVEPSVPTLTEEGSQNLLAQLLATLNAAETRAAIAKWAQDNAADKERLLTFDRGLLVGAFTKRQADVKAATKPAAAIEQTATEEKAA